MRKIIKYSFLILFLFSVPIFSEESKLTAQDYIAKLDDSLSFEDGLTKSNLTIIQSSGKMNSWNLNFFKKSTDSLILIESNNRGLEQKILNKEEGDKVYNYNVLSKKLFQKNEEEKYSKIMNSGFSYMECSGSLYQSNYNPITKSETTIDSKDFIRVLLVPIISFEYRKIILYIEKSTMLPAQLDFYGKSSTLIKTLKLKYGTVKIKKEKKISYTNNSLSRLEMMDFQSGMISVIQILEKDLDVNPDISLFNLENLGK